MDIPNHRINLPILKEKKITLHLKREDLIHPIISGNKYRKLKYNLQAAKESGAEVLLTFGGAYSNHIAAVAAAGKEFGFKTIGVIRGMELSAKWQDNPTLSSAHEAGMVFHFVSRAEYRNKNKEDFLRKLKLTFGDFYHLPEGGTNSLAVKGCEEILTPADTHFDVISCCVGTGGTMAGLINSSQAGQTVLGYQVLKGDFLKKDICNFVRENHWELIRTYDFGGYARVSPALISFINDFKENTGIPLDPVYTGKMVYGILDMAAQGRFKEGTRILAIHSGGLQGIIGMNRVLKQKKLPLLNI